MATKPYPQKEETSCVVNEPVVAYGKTASCTPLYEPTSYEMESIMKSKEERYELTEKLFITAL